MNWINKKVITAACLNIALPGSGYIYLKDRKRILVAIPLLLLALYNVGYICFVFLTDSHYSYSTNLAPFNHTGHGMMNITVYSWLTWFVITIDTLVEAKNAYAQEHKTDSSPKSSRQARSFDKI